MIGASTSTRKEYGDFQTPLEFSNIVCETLKRVYNLNPDYIFEPTCGIGNFLLSASQVFDAEKLYGIDVNKEYCDHVNSLSIPSTFVINHNIYGFDYSQLIKANHDNANWLIVGNPPWANNSDLTAMKSENLPQKNNFKQLNGFEAMTGSSNFDICEFIILQLITSFGNENATIAMLCKTLVARNVFKELHRTKQSFKSIAMYSFDAKKVFNISADCCLLVVEFEKGRNSLISKCPVFFIDKPTDCINEMGYKNTKFYSDMNSADIEIDGYSCFSWRQGVKHDCSKVMELKFGKGGLINGFGEAVKIEDTYVFPLVKSSAIKKPLLTTFDKHVIVPQKKVGQETKSISAVAPDTWAYLNHYKHLLDARKSSIYKNSPDFSVFGVGDYSYATYKVAISGFYKNPLFTLVHSDKPVMLDDTCYFIPFADYDLAYAAMLILNSKVVQQFLMSIAFFDSKRPFTKKVLDRIDFVKCIKIIDYSTLVETENQLSLPNTVSEEMYTNLFLYVTQICKLHDPQLSIC